MLTVTRNVLLFYTFRVEYKHGGDTMINPIRQLREAHGLKREELAELLGCTKRSIESIELGERKPSITLAIKIKKLFNCSLDYIYADIIKQLAG